MQCPKCDQVMEEVTCNKVAVDRCLSCKGLWFDKGEAELMSETWIAEFIDTGNPDIGEAMDDIDYIHCPRCDEMMRRFFDISVTQLQYEECDNHGKFFDAGEFTVWAQQRYLP